MTALDIAKDWLRYAKSDLNTASHMFDDVHPFVKIRGAAVMPLLCNYEALERNFCLFPESNR